MCRIYNEKTDKKLQKNKNFFNMQPFCNYSRYAGESGVDGRCLLAKKLILIIILIIMAKILKVKVPFSSLEVGDTFEKRGDVYVSEYTRNDELFKDSEYSSVYSSTYTISESYAKALCTIGYLEEVIPVKKSNVFDEIDKLMNSYKEDLENLDSDMKSSPACLKIEKKTVLENLCKLLEHLSSLRR